MISTQLLQSVILSMIDSKGVWVGLWALKNFSYTSVRDFVSQSVAAGIMPAHFILEMRTPV